MIRNRIRNLVKQYGIWRVINVTLIAGIAIFASIFALEAALPVRLNLDGSEPANTISVKSTNAIADMFRLESLNNNTTDLEVIRRGMFKPSAPLSNKLIADKIVQKIKSRLKLQCVMEMNGKRVAYLYIKGLGPKKCSEGDSVEELFTVLNIGEKSVELAIVEHKVVLRM